MNYKEFIKDLEDYREEHKIASFLSRLWYQIQQIPEKISCWYQRHTKGYCQCDVFGLGDYIIGKAYKPFIEFIRYEEEHGMSLPLKFQSDPTAWLVVLSKIEYALTDAWKVENDIDYLDSLSVMNEEQMKEHVAKVREGFLLFGEHLMDLWE